MSTSEIFGEPIYSYTRTQAIEDGVLVDMMQGELLGVCRQHYKHPVAVTAAVFELMERAADNPRTHNDLTGILHDMLWLSRRVHRQLSPSAVAFTVRINGAGRKQNHDFKLVVGPGDAGEPVITIMLPHED